MAKLTCDMIYLSENCLNTKRAFSSPCRLCIEICPHQAIQESKKLHSDLCTECGLCMAVCPSDGFIHRMSDELFDYLTSGDSVTLNCPQSVRMDFEITCLGIFDQDSWGSLLILAMEKPVNIYTGNCAECPDKPACGRSVQTLMEFYAEQLTDTLFSIKVMPDTGESTGDYQKNARTKNELSGISRRKALQGWLKTNRTKLETVMPSLINTKGYPIPKSREKLRQLLQDRVDLKVPFKILTISEKCISCGACSMICPQNALQKREDKGKLKLVFEPYKCVHCNRCIDCCPSKAVKYEVRQLSYKYLSGKILIHEGRTQYCRRCGSRLMKEDKLSLCVSCASSELSTGSNN